MILANISRRSSTIPAALLLACAVSAQTTVTVPCAADNTLYQSATGSLSNGIGDSLFCGLTGNGQIRRSVLRFDVAAAVPANATIISASLSMNVVQTTVAAPMALHAHRLLQAWGEGTSNALAGGGGGGAPSTTNDATWVHTFWSTQTWTTPGGNFAPTPTVTLSMPPGGPFSSPETMAVAAEVQSWLNNPATNYGWLLKTDETLPSTAHRCDSRESLSTSTRPKLIVTYMLPGTSGSLGVGCPVGAGTFSNAYGAAPIGGNTIAINKTGATPLSIGADFFSLAVDPVGTTLLPSCTVYLPLSQPLISGSVFLTDAAGAGSTSLAVPPGYPGYLIACQAAVLENNALGLVFSNAALACLQ